MLNEVLKHTEYYQGLKFIPQNIQNCSFIDRRNQGFALNVLFRFSILQISRIFFFFEKKV